MRHEGFSSAIDMRFHNSRQRPTYHSTRYQMRILRMLGALLVVMIAIKIVSKPSFWAWMFPGGGTVGQQSQTEQPRPTNAEIDFNIRLDDGRKLAPDEFIVPPDPELLTHKNSDFNAKHRFQIDARLLDSVRDNTLNIRRDELPAYYSLLAKARDLPPGEMEQVAERDVAFAVLMHQPRHYRGKLVTIEGDVKRLLPFDAGKNEHGLKKLWEVWLLTPDSGINPYRVVCTEIPPGIPQGETTKQRVVIRVTGYFFKKEGYASRGGAGTHAAPLLLAGQIRWIPTKPTTGNHDGMQSAAPYVIGLVCLTAIALVLTCWRLSANDRVQQTTNFHRYNELSAETFQSLQAMETSDVNDMFREMSGGQADSPEQTQDDAQ